MLASVVVLVACSLPLTALPDFLTDKEYRNSCLATPGVSHQAIRFFQKEFDSWRDQAQMIGSTMRRVFTLTFGPTLYYTLGQPDNSLNFSELMDQNTSLIVNLHGLDEETQKLLGCLIMVGIEQATIARTENRQEYHVVVDEFASFSTRNGEAYEKLLSQARKFNVFLTVAHQTNSQLQESMLKAVGNMTTEIHFRLSHDDSLYEAPRLFEHNPYQKKDEVKDKEAQDTHLPLYLSPSEILDKNAELLKNLHPRYAYVKINQHLPSFLRRFFPVTRTVKIQTLPVMITQTGKHALSKIKEHYALNYMKPEVDLANKILVPSPLAQNEDEPPPSWSP